jgi:hypothetical protein
MEQLRLDHWELGQRLVCDEMAELVRCPLPTFQLLGSPGEHIKSLLSLSHSTRPYL